MKITNETTKYLATECINTKLLHNHLIKPVVLSIPILKYPSIREEINLNSGLLYRVVGEQSGANGRRPPAGALAPKAPEDLRSFHSES